MIVVVSPQEGTVGARVEEVADLNRLHAEFRGVDDAIAEASLIAAGLGTIGGDHAWLSIAALRAAGNESPEWHRQFEEMLDYAARKGWISADGAHLQAHIVRVMT